MRSTEALDEFLKKASFDDIQKLKEDTYNSLSDYLLSYIGKNQLSQADIIRHSGLNRDYANGIFNGNKTNPSRDRLLAICFASKMSRKEMDTVLKIANLSPLYPKNERDMVLIMCINQGIYDVDSINQKLIGYDFPALETSKQAK